MYHSVKYQCILVPFALHCCYYSNGVRINSNSNYCCNGFRAAAV